MSPLFKKILAAVLTLLLSLLGGATVGGATYGVGYATGWEGPQIGPLLVYKGTVASILGSLCAMTPPVLAGGGYLAYKAFQAANKPEEK